MLDGVLKRKSFWNFYIITLVFLSAYIWYADLQVKGAIFFGIIFCASLTLFSDLTPSLLPMLLLSVFVTDCYDSADEFLALWRWGIVLAFATLFHLAYYRHKIKIGPSFKGLVAVSVAVSLAGLGKVAPRDYFSLTSLYYTIGLGVGMVLFYLLFATSFKSRNKENFAKVMYAVGVLASICVLLFYSENFGEIKEANKLLFFQPSNNLSTFIMLSLPFPFYFARKNLWHVVSAIFMYASALATLSRASLVFATVEFFILIISFALFFEKRRSVKVFYVLTALLFVGTFIAVFPFVMTAMKGNDAEMKLGFNEAWKGFVGFFTNEKESRAKLFARGIENFRENTLFGIGLSYSGNTDVYSPVKGAMNWYHMWTVQVLASMGIVGIVAYGYNLFVRVKTFIKNRSPLNMTLFLSYLGLFLMSQVNPGEFCPIPYAMIAVILFIFIEKDA